MKKQTIILVASLFCVLSQALMVIPAEALPAEIVLIRHGEKPADGNGPGGNDLSPDGQDRARKLVSYVEHRFKSSFGGLPDFIFAMAQNGSGGSNRPVETVTPLSKALGIPIHHQYLRDDYQPMVDDILSNKIYDGKIVLICWEHATILKIVHAFGVKKDDIPSKWPGSDFDSVWSVSFKNSGKAKLDTSNSEGIEESSDKDLDNDPDSED